jgi:hypothetical protein
MLLLTTLKLRFSNAEIASPVHPFGFHIPCHEPIFWFHLTVATLDAFGFMARAFDLQPPSSERPIDKFFFKSSASWPVVS